MKKIASPISLTLRRKGPITLDVAPVTQELLSAQEFLTLARENAGIIKQSVPVAPQPGDRTFGRFLVTYTYPRHKVPS